MLLLNCAKETDIYLYTIPNNVDNNLVLHLSVKTCNVQNYSHMCHLHDYARDTYLDISAHVKLAIVTSFYIDESML